MRLCAVLCLCKRGVLSYNGCVLDDRHGGGPKQIILQNSQTSLVAEAMDRVSVLDRIVRTISAYQHTGNNFVCNFTQMISE